MLHLFQRPPFKVVTPSSQLPLEEVPPKNPCLLPAPPYVEADLVLEVRVRLRTESQGKPKDLPSLRDDKLRNTTRNYEPQRGGLAFASYS